MSTAGDIIERAFKRILVGGADAAPEADEYADALADLNSMMAGFEANGIRLGYTEVDNVSDNVTIPSAAILGVVSNLAVTIAPDYGGTVSPILADQARSGMNTLRKLGCPRIRTSFPNTLPMGSGNMEYGGWDDEYFASGVFALLSLAGNSLTTDIVTADVPVKVNAFWTADVSEGLRSDVSGRIASLQSDDVAITAVLALTATGSGAYTFRVMQNGVSVATVTGTLSATPLDLTLTASLTLAPADYLEIWVEADGHTVDCVVTDAQFKVS
jgi:P22 tail accessory factor